MKKGKFAFNVTLKSTTVKMDLLVAKWRAKNKSSVSQKCNHAWKRSIAQNFAEFGENSERLSGQFFQQDSRFLS